MFPSHFTAYRRPNHALSALLASPTCTLAGILALDGVIDECRVENKTLIGFLRRPTVVAELVQYALWPSTGASSNRKPAGDDETISKGPSGSETESTGGADVSTDGADVASAPSGAPAQPASPPASEQSAEQQAHASKLSTAAADILALSNWQLIDVFEDPALFALLFDVLATPGPLAPLIATRFVSLALAVIHFKPSFTYSYLAEHAHVADALLRHVHVEPVSKIPIAMVEAASGDGHEKLVAWLGEVDFIRRVIARLSAPGVGADEVLALGDLFVGLVDAAAGRKVVRSPVSDALVAAPSLAAWIALAASREHLSLALSAITRTLLLRAMCVIEAGGLSVELAPAPAVPVMPGMPEPPVPHEVRLANERARLSAAAREGELSPQLAQLASMFPMLVAVLAEAPLPELATQYSVVIAQPLGSSRLEVLVFLATIVAVSDARVDAVLTELGFFARVLALFFASPCNNALHNVTVDLLGSVLRKAEVEGASRAVVDALLADGALVDRILTAVEIDAAKEAGPKGFRGAHMAHVHLLANMMQSSPWLAAVLGAQPRWLTFVTETLEPFNTKNATPIAGGGRSPSFADSHSDGMQMLSSAPSSLEDLQQILSSFLGGTGRADLASFVDVENFMDDEDEYDEDDAADTGVPRGAGGGGGAAAAGGREHFDALGGVDDGDFEFGPDRVARLGDDSFGAEDIGSERDPAPSDGGPVERFGHSDDELDDDRADKPAE